MKPVSVLIVDDSAVFRSQIRAALDGVPGVQVAGTASNGKLALQLLEQVQVDLLTVDLEMPEMNGIELLKALSRQGRHLKTIVLSSTSRRGAETTLEALSLGASDFIAKPSGEEAPSGNQDLPHEKLRALLLPRIQALFQESSASPARDLPFNRVVWELFLPRVIVIGSSTGGPTALEHIFSRIKGPFRCPILIAQHMPPVFTASLAERLGKLSGVPAAEGVHGETLVPNRIYVAPGNYHMELEPAPGGGTRISLNQKPPVNMVRPAVDPLFSSAASLYKEKCLAIVLTGMGEDGKRGSIDIKSSGGAVLIQDESSCVVFGMPGAVFKAGSYDQISDLDGITRSLREKAAA